MAEAGVHLQNVLVTGGDGQLGTALGRCAWPAGWRAAISTRRDLDLTDPTAIADRIAGQPWAAVINAAAYTAVDRAESQPVAAWAANALAPAALAESCARSDVPLVHLSTDYVFGGTDPRPREVDDRTSPQGVYAASKLGGEWAVRTGGGRSVIVRTAWLFAPTGHNFVRTMLRLAKDRSTIRVVDDQIGSPTSADDLARALVTITTRLAKDRAAPVGTFHYANAGTASWADFAREIFRQSAARGGPIAQVEPIRSADYATAAVRPRYSALSCSAIAAAYAIVPRPWQAALAETMDALVGPVR